MLLLPVELGWGWLHQGIDACRAVGFHGHHIKLEGMGEEAATTLGAKASAGA